VQDLPTYIHHRGWSGLRYIHPTIVLNCLGLEGHRLGLASTVFVPSLAIQFTRYSFGTILHMYTLRTITMHNYGYHSHL